MVLMSSANLQILLVVLAVVVIHAKNHLFDNFHLFQ